MSALRNRYEFSLFQSHWQTCVYGAMVFQRKSRDFGRLRGIAFRRSWPILSWSLALAVSKLTNVINQGWCVLFQYLIREGGRNFEQFRQLHQNFLKDQGSFFRPIDFFEVQSTSKSVTAQQILVKKITGLCQAEPFVCSFCVFQKEGWLLVHIEPSLIFVH